MSKVRTWLCAGWASAVLMALQPYPAAAQESAEATQTDSQADIPDAQQLGQRLYLYDQAAWHATDELATSVDLGSPGPLRGYLVVPLDNGNLSTVFYAEDSEGYYEFARYEVAGSAVVGGAVLNGDKKTRLSAMLQAMAAAKAAAIDEMVRQDWGSCSESSPNTLILPPDAEGTISVYFLTSTTQDGVYPFGGHYRADIAADGSVAGARKFTNSCLNMKLQTGADGVTPMILGISHLLDEEPTEIHYFQSYYVPVPVLVIIGKIAWVIENGVLLEKIDDIGD